MSTTVIARETLAPSPPAIRLKRRWASRTLLLLGLAFAAAAGGGWYGYRWWTAGRFIETTDDAYAGGNVTAVAPHVAGFVAEIAVADNQYVRAGQLLVRLDARDYRAALDHAEAAAQQKAAALAGLQAKYALQQTTIRQAEATLAGRLAQAKFAAADAVRYRDLAVTSFGSRQNAERSSAADAVALSATQSADAGLVAARQQLAVLDADIAQARAAIVQAEADVASARLALGYTEIRAPIDGYIGNRAAQIGAYVASGAYLLSVIPARGLWVDANFKEDQLARMRPGEAATIVADVLPGRTFHGRVLSLAPGTGAVFSVIPPENATGNFTKIVQRVPVRVALDDGQASLAALRPGLSMTVSIDTKPARGIPSPAGGSSESGR